MGYKKTISFLVIPKSPKVLKKVEKIGLGSLSLDDQKIHMCLLFVVNIVEFLMNAFILGT